MCYFQSSSRVGLLFGWQLDQKLLYHVLSTALNDSEEAELSSAQIHNLASAAVQAFGENQAGATMADPVQEKDTDPVRSPKMPT